MDLEDDMDIENEEELLEDHNNAKLASEINMIKSMSQEMLASGEEKIKNAKHGDSVDKYMNHDQVQQTLAGIERKYSIDGMDKETVEKLQKQASKEQFKAMKNLNKMNERATPTMIAKRKQSIQM